MTLPTVTIGVTTYNAEESIRAALRSAFEQTMPILQILVVDDCSTDSTMSILEDYADHPGFEIYQNQTNSGVAISRNEIIKQATGDFIVFFDDDDVSASTRVESQVDRIIKYENEFANGAPVVCHTARLQIYPDGSQRTEATMGQVLGKVAPAGVPVARRALMGEPLEDGYGSCATCSQAARAKTYRGLNGFDAQFRRCEDSDFAIRFADSGGHFAGLAEPLVTQLMTDTSEKNLQTIREFSIMLIDKHRPLFDNDVSYNFSRNWVSLKFDWLAGQSFKFIFEIVKLALAHPLMVWQRLKMALPSLSNNRAFKRFSRENN
jgi:glycosyltransferase involved in cell wall biosynthesis